MSTFVLVSEDFTNRSTKRELTEEDKEAFLVVRDVLLTRFSHARWGATDLIMIT